MLIQQLRALEDDGVLERIDYKQVPPRVEYRLTPVGQGLEPPLNALRSWAAALPAPADGAYRPGPEAIARAVRAARPAVSSRASPLTPNSP
jgi:hypothetical protein